MKLRSLFLAAASAFVFACSVQAATPETLALAEKVVEAGGMRASMEDNFMGTIDAAMGQLRKTGGEELTNKVTEVARQFFRENYKWESVRQVYVEAYAAEFSDDELKGLLAFYESPVGKKFVEKSAPLGRKAALAVNAKMQDKMPALQAAMMDAVKKHLEGKAGK